MSKKGPAQTFRTVAKSFIDIDATPKQDLTIAYSLYNLVEIYV